MRAVRRRRSGVRRELVRVRKKLERLNHKKLAAVDLAGPRQEALRHITKDIAELHLTADSAPAMDVIIDGHAATWRQSVERLRHSGLATLDHLEAEVRSLIARLDERCDEERDVLSELQSVAANLWDQVGEPEQPKLDPLR